MDIVRRKLILVTIGTSRVKSNLVVVLVLESKALCNNNNNNNNIFSMAKRLRIGSNSSK